MPHVSKKQLTNKTKNLIWERLVYLLQTTKQEKEMSICLDGLLTKTEKVMIGKRLMASLLIQSGWGVKSITDFLNVSSSTVYRLEQKIALEENYQHLLMKLFPEPIPKLDKSESTGIEKLIQDIFAGYRNRDRLRNPEYHRNKDKR